MDEKRFAVLLTDAQEVLLMACNPQQELFYIARQAIGCDWIELVEAEPLAKQGMLMMIDEEGKLKPGAAFINCMASHLYGAENHGDPIVGNAVVVKTTGEQLELMTEAEARQLATDLEQIRASAIARITEKFAPRPAHRTEHSTAEMPHQQPCTRSDQER